MFPQVERERKKKKMPKKQRKEKGEKQREGTFDIIRQPVQRQQIMQQEHFKIIIRHFRHRN